VPWAEGKYSRLSADEHRTRDATTKSKEVHELTDGICIYGLGINGIAYKRMSESLKR